MLPPVKIYLLLYNFLQVFGWSLIAAKAVLALCESKTHLQLYLAVADEVNIFQTAALLEVLHSLLGFVRSPVGTTFAQVLSRIVITWPVAYGAQTSRHSVGVPMFVLAWSISEIVRYSFYALSLVNSVPFFLTWLRYTLFIVLYPIGVSGELLTLTSALPEVKSRRLYSVSLPNAANISFNGYYALILFALMYIPVFPQLYCYMLGQRKKVLGGKGPAKRD